MKLEIDPNPSAMAGEAIKPYLTADSKFFAADFWMHNRLGAQQGASVDDYMRALVTLGRLGAFSYDGDDANDVGDGNGRTIHNYVVGPDDPSRLWNETMTSPGTIGWNPLGAMYRYIGGPRDHGINAAAWEQAGCPKFNAWGEWGTGGLPQEYVEWSWGHPTTRGPSPFGQRRGDHKGRVR